MDTSVSPPLNTRRETANAEGEPLIRLSRVSKEYVSGDSIVHALRSVDLEIRAGEFVAIVGTSGSGKSTMMNMLGCLDRPTSGSYVLAGIDAGGRSNDARALIRNRLIGFIFQGFNLLPRTTALENCELPLQYRGIPAAERHRRSMEALKSVGLGSRVHHTPNQLSGGQQQRVAIARALVTDPPLLLADEPTGNLDTRTSLEVLALLQELNRKRGITICLVTHEKEIAGCAKRIITMRDGRILSDEVQAEPIDAVAELAALPPVEEPPRPKESEEPAARARRRLGGPVPGIVFAVQLLALGVGAVAGWGYSHFVLGTLLAPPIVAVAFLVEAILTSYYARRRLGRSLTPDQGARVAIYSAVGHLVAVAALAAFLVKGRRAGWAVALAKVLVERGAVVAVGVTLGVLLALSVLRFLLLTLVGPRK